MSKFFTDRRPDVVTVDIPSLPLIDRADFPGLPASMELRLMAPDVLLFNPAAEMHVAIPLTDLDNLPRYIEQLNIALLKQAMGEPPESEQGYRVDV